MNMNNLKNIPETKSLEESQAILDEIFQGLDEQDEMGLKSIVMALSLPEKEFALLSENILNETEKALNNVEDKMLMVQALNASGQKAEDLTAVFVKLCEEVDEKLADQLSQQKIDFLKRFLGLMTEAVNATEGIAKRTIPVSISYCHPDATKPLYAHAGDAGMDIKALEDIVVKPGETVLVKTGIKVALPLGYELQVRPRSGQSLKTKLRVANSPGTIDANYRDEIGVIIENIEPRIVDITTEDVVNADGSLDHLKVTSIEYGRDFIIEKGQRFAQLVLSEKPMCLFYEVEDVKNIEGDRAGGFGHTGLK